MPSEVCFADPRPGVPLDDNVPRGALTGMRTLYGGKGALSPTPTTDEAAAANTVALNPSLFSTVGICLLALLLPR